MSWSIRDLLQFTQDFVGSDTGDDRPTDDAYGEFIYNSSEEDLSPDEGTSTLSMDEVRQSLDEYEEILRT